MKNCTRAKNLRNMKIRVLRRFSIFLRLQSFSVVLQEREFWYESVFWYEIFLTLSFELDLGREPLTVIIYRLH